MNQLIGEHDMEGELQQSTPRIYVASLADYNAGRLFGEWMDAAAADLAEQVEAMLAGSTEPIAEEWAIHDYEGFGPWSPHEYEDLRLVGRVALGIAEYGPAFAHLAADIGAIDEVLDRFDEVYLGHWPSLEAYAEELLDEVVDPTQLGPDWLRPYVKIDYEAYARDLATEVHVSEPADGGVYVFHP